MRFIHPFIVLLFTLFTIGCSGKKDQLPEVPPPDTTITIENSFSELFFDSTSLGNFINQHTTHDTLAYRMRSFYSSRNFQFAWFFNDGPADYAYSFLHLQNDYIHYSGDSTLYNPELAARVDSLDQLSSINPHDSIIIDTELQLTRQFFRYAYYAYSGDRSVDIQELDWFIPRRKINTVAFLDSLLQNRGQNISKYEPVNRQYNMLKDKLLRYYQYADKNEWMPITTDKKSYKIGDSSAVIRKLKERLYVLGDLTTEDTTHTFNDSLLVAVKRFQERHGLTVDAAPGVSFFAELNHPLNDRIRQILINMERVRWMPDNPGTDFLLINIPEYKLRAYDEGKYAFSMNVVVGSTAHSTVIFSGKLNQVVFSPYWNVPNSILKNEILPAIKRNPNYLARHNMEWHGNMVRQKPGKNNSLGLVKFLFPNSYNIYLHDTPSKSLFGESRRAFSHGCIRLAEPQKLAEFILRKDSTWTTEKIVAAMNSGKEKYVRVRPEVPVVIGYFTAFVDSNGQLNFRNDIYGHDKKMQKRLFEKGQSI